MLYDCSASKSSISPQGFVTFMFLPLCTTSNLVLWNSVLKLPITKSGVFTGKMTSKGLEHDWFQTTNYTV